MVHVFIKENTNQDHQVNIKTFELFYLYHWVLSNKCSNPSIGFRLKNR